MIKIKKILCPVDFSPASEKAARYAVQLASNYDAKLRLLHVVSPLMPTAYEFPLNANSVIQGMEDDAKLEMAKLLAKIEVKGVDIETEARTGDIFTQIKKSIAEYKPDLLALG